MTPTPTIPPLTARRSVTAHAAILLFIASLGWAQALAPDAATLAKFDKNKNGRLDADEAAALQAAQAATTKSVDSASAQNAGSSAEAPVALSPFEVVADNKGYFAGNTMSGTRLNSKLEDVGAAITVMTKEQMADFAMLDINDIFLYSVGTEGTGEYTDFAVNNAGSVADNVQNNPRGANRIRGIGSANLSFGNVGLSGLTPVDALNIEGVELSRGPNANVFGLGSAGGTLNMIPANANLTKNRTQVGSRADSLGGHRFDLDANRVLWKNRLAFRVSGAFQHDGYVRKPAGTDTVRYNGMVQFKPFKSTTINASYAYYRMNGNRPNTIMPRDGISYWLEQGKPAWDPFTSTYTVNGVTTGLNGPGPAATRTAITSDNNLPDVFQRSFSGADKSYVFVDRGAVAYWTTPTGNTNASISPLLNNSSNRYLAASPATGVAAGRITSQPLFTTTPSLSDKTYYDWSEVNLGAMNRLTDRTLVSRVQIQQVFFSTPRQTLFGSGDWAREDSRRYQRNIFGTAATNQLLVDVNSRLLDGTPNPFFGRTYLGLDQPLTQWIPGRGETFRAQLAYKLDLTQEKGWLKWAGLHNLTGYDEYGYTRTRRFSYRDVLASNHSWVPPGTLPALNGSINGGQTSANARFRGYFRYYVGDATGTNVDYAPSTFNYGPATYVWGNSATGVFQRENAVFDQRPTLDSAGGGSNSQTVSKTTGAVIQSMFLGGRLVTTFGTRDDKVYDKRGTEPRLLLPDGSDFNYRVMNGWAQGDYAKNGGPTKTAGAVLRPFRDIGFINRAGQQSGVVGFGARVLDGLTLTYNQSDSFNPQGPQQDQLRRQLPNSTGEGKDMGFWLNMNDGKFVLRVNRFETKRIKTRGGDAATIAQRSLRIDVFQNDAHQLVNNARAWIQQFNPTFTPAQVDAEIARQTGLSVEEQRELQLPDPGISSTQDVESRGTEIELNFNPTKYWTVQSSFSATETTNTNVNPATTEWIARRLPFWTTIRDPRSGTLWWDTPYGGNTAHSYFTNSVDLPFKILQQQQGKANPQIRKYRVKASTNYQLAGLTQHRILKNFNIGGAVRWEDKAGIGYYGVQKFPASITELDATNPIYDKAHYYVDAFVSYRMKLFNNKVGANIQLNARNLGENGRLQPVGAFPNGTPLAYRIVDPALYILQVKFDL